MCVCVCVMLLEGRGGVCCTLIGRAVDLYFCKNENDGFQLVDARGGLETDCACVHND